MAVIEVENLSKHYRLGSIGASSFLQDCTKFGRSIGLPFKKHKNNNIFTALDDVSFSVEEGEVLGIIGANGAGKSTLLKILSRITEPSSGIAKLSGRVGSLLEVGPSVRVPLIAGLQTNLVFLAEVFAKGGGRTPKCKLFFPCRNFLGTKKCIHKYIYVIKMHNITRKGVKILDLNGDFR